MKRTQKYVVGSQTNRSEQGRPDLCWMDIRVEKLDECCATDEKYYFECEIGGSIYKYCMSGEELKRAFIDNHVAIKTNKNSICYSFYFDYRKGEIYDKLSESESKLVCRLQPLAESDHTCIVTQINMKETPKYIVRSETNRSEQGRPDLCWMDIRVEKLDECCATDEKYYFECEIGGSIYKYCMSGEELKRAFIDNHVAIKTNKNSICYSFYFDYLKGEIYDTVSKSSGKLICRLQATGEVESHPNSTENHIVKSRDSRLFDELDCVCGEQELEKNLGENISVIADLVAKTAVWAPIKYHLDCEDAQGTCFAKYPNIRRKKANEKRGVDPENPDIRLDDNSYPNRQMKEMGKDAYHCDFKGYTVCHVWEGTCYNEKYHTCFANLVLLPAALSSFTDFNQEIQSILKYRSYELYHWLPDGEEAPTKPRYYPEDWINPPSLS